MLMFKPNSLIHIKIICSHPEHEPPMYLYIPPDKEYIHKCPSCGKTRILRGSFYFFNENFHK